MNNIGKSVTRIDGLIKVTGKAKYIADLSHPGMLYAKILLSNHAHANIINIDTSKAEQYPGVVEVVTGKDAPNQRYGLYLRDRLIFAKDRVRHIGEPVAAVAAISEKVASEALQLINVSYQDLPEIFNVEDALKPDAPIIHPLLEGYVPILDYANVKYGNVCMDVKFARGDVESAFSESDSIFEDTYQTQSVTQASIETHGCLAEMGTEGQITIWTGTQQLSVCHEEVALALDIPQTKVRIIPAWIGGGFGGKLKSRFEPIIALLAMKAGKPVKLVLTRKEEFVTTHSRAPYITRIKTGVKANGEIIARDVDVYVDVGAYSDHAIGAAAHAVNISTGPYRIPNFRARGRAIYTNNPDWGCMRGYGAPEITFAIESQMEKIARSLNIDPAEFRMKNLAEDGDRLASGDVLHDVRIRETMQAALTASRYWEKKQHLGKNQGIGIANSILVLGLLSSSASIRVNGDGTVTLITSVTDIGTGTYTAFTQIIAEMLSIPIENVYIAQPNSEVAPYDTGSIASRTVYDSGNAIRLAAQDVIDQLVQLAESELGCNQGKVIWQSGKAVLRDDPTRNLSFTDLIQIAMYSHHGPVVGHGSWLSSSTWKMDNARKSGEATPGTFGFGTHVVCVEVDPETGKTRILNYTAAHDVGRVINPTGLEGQIEGGVAQGIGYALYEDLIVKDGVLVNPSFTDYHLPTIFEIPAIDMVFDEKPDASGPFGAKGIGEPPIIPVAAAIANAIYDATGVQVKQLPISQERLYFALKEAETMLASKKVSEK
jgi:CO/xanthine dehydrogenase Mo-binding subunit